MHGNHAGIGNEGKVRNTVDCGGEILVERGLWFTDAHGIVVSWTHDHLNVGRYLAEVRAELLILLDDVGDGELLLLSREDAHPINHIPHDEEVLHVLRNGALRIATGFAAEPGEEFLKLGTEEFLRTN